MSALNSSIEPRKEEYAGDEVSAVVLDPGYSTIRAGFAGEDTPKSVIPTYYAVTDSNPIFGDHVVDVPREDAAIRNPMSRDGVVEDWNVAEDLFKNSFAAKLTGVRPNRVLQDWLNHDETGKPFADLQQKMAEAVDTERCLEDNPLFMTEPPWNPVKAREKSAEVALESWGTPGFYLGRTGVMAAFSAGKPTALVVDIGAATASVTPVHDGFILKKGVQRSNLAGDFISSQVRNMFATNQPQPIVIHPHYLVKSKMPVDAGQPANAVYKEFPAGFKPPQQSFRRYQEERTLLEFKELVVQVWTGPTPLVGQEEMARGLPGKPFEFPDGYNQLFTSDRFKVAESLFDHRAYVSPPSSPEVADLFPAPGPEKTILAMIKQSLSAVDVDIRPILLSNVVVTGGSSLIPGFTQRLNTELDRMFPSTRIKLQASGNLVERKFGSWIGGSIMASLGTFHQMWISKKEYDEHGAGIVEKRCR